MKVFKRRLRSVPNLLGDTSNFSNERGSRVVCARWLWDNTNLPHDQDFIHICIAAHYVRDAFHIRIGLEDELYERVYVDKETAFTPSHAAFNQLIRQHGREIGQHEWIAWLWFEYTL